MKKMKQKSRALLQKANHPDHSVHLPRLRRVAGQIQGIERMIQEGRYCPDILTQLKAAASAIAALEAEIFKSHLNGCVRQAFDGKSQSLAEEKIQEIIKLIY